MDSKRRRKATSVNPTAKRKINPLLVAVQNEDFDKLKDLVNNYGVCVSTTGHFSFKGFVFNNIPALFAALLTDQENMINYLACKHPHFPLRSKRNCEAIDTFILPSPEKLGNENSIELIDILELTGASLIFKGDPGNHGWVCWKEALQLRTTLSSQAYPKLAQHTVMQQLALNRSTEISSLKELDGLWLEDDTHRKIQAFLVSQRILTKYCCFPNRFTVHNFFKFALDGWEKRKFNLCHVFLTTLYLLELFETTSFVELTKEDKPEDSFEVIKSTLVELHKILQDRNWIQYALKEKNSVLNFDHLMIVLNFSCNHHLKFHSSWADDKLSNQPHLELISDLIIVVLQVIVESKQTEDNLKQVKDCLKKHVCFYKLKPVETKTNLLVGGSSTLQMQTEFTLIKLFLETEAELNTAKQQFGPLFLLKKLLFKTNTVLTFEDMMMILCFLCQHQTKLDLSCPDEEPTKPQHLELISDLIHRILKQMMLIPQQIDSKRLKLCLATYIRQYENGPAKEKPNILVRECSTLTMTHDTDFGLIKLLLGLGANPNSVDNQRRSPLHLLASKESVLHHKWTDPEYSTHIQNFAAIVREFLVDDGRYHDDQFDLSRKTALDCLNQYSHGKQYPDPEVSQLLSNHLQGVRPLSCLAAKVVKFYHLPCQDLPVTVQTLVLQH